MVGEDEMCCGSAEGWSISLEKKLGCIVGGRAGMYSGRRGWNK